MKHTLSLFVLVSLLVVFGTAVYAEYVPGATDMFKLEQAWASIGAEPDLPLLDWRDFGGTNYMSPVENQYTSGLCWAFGSSHGLVSRIKIEDGVGFSTNFSEDAIGDCVYPAGPSYGGNFWKAGGYFCWRGPVDETCQMWNMGTTNCNPACPQLDYRLTRMRTIGASTAAIKAALVNGPVVSSLDTDVITGFNGYNGTYVITSAGATTTTDHCVLIVGYHEGTGDPGYFDGDYWICKNSWSSTWGDNGYFYISYGLANLGSANAQYWAWDSSVDTLNGEILYQDEAGAVGSISAGTNVLYGCQRLVPTMDGQLTQIQFNNAGNNFTWTANVYDNKSGANLSGPMTSQMSGSNEPYGGILTVDLPSPVSVYAGNDIYVAVRMHNPTDTYHPCDTDGPVSGEAFYSTSSISSGYAVNTFGDWGIHAIVIPNGPTATPAPPTATPTPGIQTPSTGPMGIGILLLVIGGLLTGLKRRR